MDQTSLDVGALHTANCTIAGALIYALALRNYVVKIEKVNNIWYASAYNRNGEDVGQTAKESMTDAVKQLYDYLP